MTYCPQCGKRLGEGDHFCGQCGSYADCDGEDAGAPPPSATAEGPAPSRVAFVILGAFFGAFGVHNFYIGRTNQGLAQLLITLLSCGALSLVSAVWAIVDICTITKDPKGRYLT